MSLQVGAQQRKQVAQALCILADITTPDPGNRACIEYCAAAGALLDLNDHIILEAEPEGGVRGFYAAALGICRHPFPAQRVDGLQGMLEYLARRCLKALRHNVR